MLRFERSGFKGVGLEGGLCKSQECSYLKLMRASVDAPCAASSARIVYLINGRHIVCTGQGVQFFRWEIDVRKLDVRDPFSGTTVTPCRD
jgi:hypothetical protein